MTTCEHVLHQSQFTSDVVDVQMERETNCDSFAWSDVPRAPAPRGQERQTSAEGSETGCSPGSTHSSEREKAHQTNFLSLGFLMLTPPQHTPPPIWEGEQHLHFQLACVQMPPPRLFSGGKLGSGGPRQFLYCRTLLQSLSSAFSCARGGGQWRVVVELECGEGGSGHGGGVLGVRA